MLLTLVDLEMESAMQLLIMVTALLTLATFLLFTITVSMRLRRNWQHKKMKEYRDLYLPLIFDYLEGNVELSTFQNLIGSDELKFRTFEDTVIKLIKNVEGEEAKKLKKALMLKSLYRFHLKQLKSDSDELIIDGCNYFRYTNIANDQVIGILEKLLHSKNTYLAFSAASALMASDTLRNRMYALEIFAKRKGITKMALLELFWRFKRDHKGQNVEEAEFLKALISDDNLTSKKRTLLIQAVSESNYYLMIKPLQDWLESNEDRWKEPGVLSALIDAQRIFLNSEATESIKTYLQYPDQKVRKVAHEAILVLDQQFIYKKAIA